VKRTRFRPRFPRTLNRPTTPHDGAGPRTTNTTRPGALSVNVIRAALRRFPCVRVTRPGRARIPVTLALRLVEEGRRGRSRPVEKYVGEVATAEPEPPAAGVEEEGPEAGDDDGAEEEEEEEAGEGEGETGSGTATGGFGTVTAGGGGRGGVGAAGVGGAGGGAVGIGSEIVGTETVTGSPTSPSA
jgi:hypothetical protein